MTLKQLRAGFCVFAVFTLYNVNVADGSTNKNIPLALAHLFLFFHLPFFFSITEKYNCITQPHTTFCIKLSKFSMQTVFYVLYENDIKITVDEWCTHRFLHCAYATQSWLKEKRPATNEICIYLDFYSNQIHFYIPFSCNCVEKKNE